MNSIEDNLKKTNKDNDINNNNNNTINTIELDHQDIPSTENLNKGIKMKTLRTPRTITIPEKDEELEYERIKDSKFHQQRLPAWRPVPTIGSIIIVFSFFGIAFITLGIILLIYANKIKTEEIDYTECPLTENYCQKKITIKDDISKPVFVYYQLDGFYQNARRYVKSKSIDQLTGDNINAVDNCDPLEYNSEMGFNENTTAIDNITKLKNESIAVPCGLIAKTFFNDSYEFFINGNNLIVEETDIAYKKDIDLFKESDFSEQWMNITNEHFIIWMRPDGLPNTRKLWGRIEQDLKKGDSISINITNNYDVKYYDGKKKIILSNVTVFGGKNTFLAVCYIVVGGLSLISAFIFLIGYKIQMSKEKEL